MDTTIGAGWAHGGVPPWMERPPWFDEAHAADRDQDARAATLAVVLAEWYGPLDALEAERQQPRLSNPNGIDTPDDYAYRRTVLERAMRSTTSPNPRGWRRRPPLEHVPRSTDHPAATGRRAA